MVAVVVWGVGLGVAGGGGVVWGQEGGGKVEGAATRGAATLPSEWVVGLESKEMKRAVGEVVKRLGGLGAGKTAAKLREEAPAGKRHEGDREEGLEVRVWRGFEDAVEDGGRAVGLLVWVWPRDGGFEVPEGWREELGRRRMVVVWPVGVGNDRGAAWRLVATVVAARKAMEEIEVDPGRVYVAGLSGGGRMSGIAGMVFPELFAGAMPICGISHYHNVPTEVGGKKYYQGFFPGLAKEWVDRAKRNVFVLVTGTEDGNCKPTIRVSEVMTMEGFGGVRLQVEEGMGHTLPGKEGFTKALAALDEPAMNEAVILGEKAARAEGKGDVGEALKLARMAWGRDGANGGARERVKRLGEMREKERKEAEGKGGLVKKWEEKWR